MNAEQSLRKVLFGNAVFSGLGCSGFVLLRNRAETDLALDAGLSITIGAALGLYAAWLVMAARRDSIVRSEVSLFVFADGLWVVATVAYLGLEPDVTAEGAAAVAAIATVVAGFGVAQYRLLRAARIPPGALS